MKKQALSLFLAGALALSLFGCSAQPAAESAPQTKNSFLRLQRSFTA